MRLVHPSRRLRSLSSGGASRGPGGKLLRMRSVSKLDAASGMIARCFHKGLTGNK